MVSAAWRMLDAEIARWRDAGRPVEFWWRDDDAVRPAPAVARLLDLAAQTGVPLALAVIPDSAVPELFALLGTGVSVLATFTLAAPQYNAADGETDALQTYFELLSSKVQEGQGKAAAPVCDLSKAQMPTSEFLVSFLIVKILTYNSTRLTTTNWPHSKTCCYRAGHPELHLRYEQRNGDTSVNWCSCHALQCQLCSRNIS